MADEKIGVVGAGLMGAEIALVFALAGHDVVLSDRTDEHARRRPRTGSRRCSTAASRAASSRRRTSALALARIRTTVALDPISPTAISSPRRCSRTRRSRPRSTARSTGSAARPASSPATPRRSRSRPWPPMSARRAGRAFIGTHYFSPASRMKLVEVIPAFETAPETVETAMRLCREAGKTPIRVKDVAGFAVNRMFLIFLAEAVRLVEDGVATPGGHRHGLPARPRPPDGAVRADGRDRLETGLADAGNPARGLWRALPPARPC